MILPVSLITTPKRKSQSKANISMSANPASVSINRLYHEESHALNAFVKLQKATKKAIYKLQDSILNQERFFDEHGDLSMIGKRNYKDEFGVKYKFAREFYKNDKIMLRNLYAQDQDQEYKLIKQYTYSPETHNLESVEYFRNDGSIQIREKYDYSNRFETCETTKFDEAGNIIKSYINPKIS